MIKYLSLYGRIKHPIYKIVRSFLAMNTDSFVCGTNKLKVPSQEKKRFAELHKVARRKCKPYTIRKSLITVHCHIAYGHAPSSFDAVRKSPCKISAFKSSYGNLSMIQLNKYLQDRYMVHHLWEG